MTSPSLQIFFDSVARQNPFESNRMTPVTAGFADAPSVFAEPFERMQRIAADAHRDATSAGILLLGEAGIGKSHLLGRLERWAAADAAPALFLSLANLQAEPERMPRALLRGVMGLLTRGRERHWVGTPLFRLVNGMFRLAVAGEVDRPHTRAEVERGVRQLLERWTSEAPGRAALLDRTVFEVLCRFQYSVLQWRASAFDDGLALLAVRWLRGDTLETSDARRLGLPPAANRDEGVSLADDEQVKRVTVALAQAAWCWGRPMVLALDQVDNLEPAQFRALARFLHALLDAAPNLVVLTAGVQATLLRWREEKAIQDSSWDRLAQHELALQRLSPMECLPLLEVRLRQFLTPVADLPEISERTRRDPLFPLGQAWFRDCLADRVAVRPRDAILWAGRGWEQQQALLRVRGGEAWLATWTETSPPAPPPRPLTPDQLAELVDRTVLQRLDDLHDKKREELASQGWDPDGLGDLLHALAGHWLKKEHWPYLLNVERVTVDGQQRPTLHLLLRQRLSPMGPDVSHGAACLLSGDGTTLTSQLRRIRELEEAPDQLALIHEEGSGFRPGAKGREYYGELQQQYGDKLRLLPVTLEEHAQLAGLEAVLRECRSGELEAALPGGVAHRIGCDEALASLLRQELFWSSPLLRWLITLKLGQRKQALLVD